MSQQLCSNFKVFKTFNGFKEVFYILDIAYIFKKLIAQEIIFIYLFISVVP